MKVSVIHQTDLFHPHADPDDHWDLACQYALAYIGDIELKGILLDYPPNVWYGDPSIQSVNQMNFITGQSIRAAVGTSKARTAEEVSLEDIHSETSGVNMVLEILEDARTPVVIHIVGSCRDISIAGKLRPDLFREKCRAIYLNAGASSPESKLEYNVRLDPVSYSIIFSLPCPIYWMPCFDNVSNDKEIGDFSTFYQFQQKAILPNLSDAMQKYFAYALGRIMDPKWLYFIIRAKVDEYIELYGEHLRNMWCTGGFLHTASKTVTLEGDIVKLNQEGIQPVYTFEPIEVTCDNQGKTTWNLTTKPTNRYIFKIQDKRQYQEAMTIAMKSLLMKLP